MKLIARPCELLLANPWKIASTKGSGTHRTVIVELTDADGVAAIGEAAPSSLYGESADSVLKFLHPLDAQRLSFVDIPGSMKFLESLPGIPVAARCALNLALLDGAAKRARQPLHDFLGLGFREQHHVTSFSIGIDAPDIIRRKVLDAAEYPVIKLKVGDPRDRENFAALRSAAPKAGTRGRQRRLEDQGGRAADAGMARGDGPQHPVRGATDAARCGRGGFDLAQGAFAAAGLRR